MTVRYWRESKTGAPIFKVRRLRGGLIGSLMLTYITLAYDRVEIDSLGELA